MELENLDLFLSFLDQNLKREAYDADAYLEKLIIHWGETGLTTFSLDADETRSGQAETIAYAVRTRYFIKENGQEIPIEDLSEGYDLYRPVLCFTAGQAAPEQPEPPAPHTALNPLHLIRHKSGIPLRTVSEHTGIAPEELLQYEENGYPLETLPLGTAAAIAKALHVHAEDLLSCAPTMPAGRKK